eukprot:CAMPEP_0184735440 /NCGR_PEP_ID=MMETSP0314-20130426/61895_1 /TAXON_ID=38298 /ORGANISM="Rhodella maculata, Strain CCMP 736" /LENGTH=108 /DNA_ID=CAMNT_0027202483 /DNA_START=1345 /DNA_END=1668 /DNA_ORIENTATION=+
MNDTIDLTMDSESDDAAAPSPQRAAPSPQRAAPPPQRIATAPKNEPMVLAAMATGDGIAPSNVGLAANTGASSAFLSRASSALGIGGVERGVGVQAPGRVVGLWVWGG